MTFRPSLPTSRGVGSPVGIGLPRRLTDAGFFLGWCRRPAGDRLRSLSAQQFRQEMVDATKDGTPRYAAWSS